MTDHNTAVDETVEFSSEEIEAVLATDKDDENTELGLTRGDLKAAIRRGAFDEEELDAIVEQGVFTDREIEILQANGIDGDANDDEVDDSGDEKPKKVKKTTGANQKLIDQITQVLEKSTVGMTVDEIAVDLGVLREDFDPKDSETRSQLKKFRALARKAVDNHPEGDRSSSAGRNRLYAIGEVQARIEDADTEDDDDGDEEDE